MKESAPHASGLVAVTTHQGRGAAINSRPLHWALAIAATGCVAGCSESPHESAYARVPPFDSLGATLGSTAAEVRRARPAVKYVPYGGLVEERASGSIMFGFRDSRESVISDGERTTQITIVRPYGKDSASAHASLASEAERIATLLGDRPLCGRISLPFANAHVRVWQSLRDELEVGVWADSATFRLIYVLKRDPLSRAYIQPGDCDSAARSQ